MLPLLLNAQTKVGVIRVGKDTIATKTINRQPVSRGSRVQVTLNPKVKPSYPQGNQSLDQFISDNINCPQDARKKKACKKVEVKFLVDLDGRIMSVKCIKYCGKPTCDEAIRVIKLSAPWDAARSNGKKVVSFASKTIKCE